ncbi:MAG: 50S ribosomal protein L22 [Deltaproteobacteria bacterium GWC2_42_51]|nr:MAG: 50S ribosomal protein L22 [Deltaproteobacteria bacterium GWA2_42_85]OGP32688.1 MAG: 50S ribosomal protein L22 [Deltaproteobacteria bacterium GWC2_42_51]OGP39122.1 MAG: 50S ribosomal protein L22 [Deltaproteobacteria bacterium GWD2_42_10]OGP47944.1 MAG: 50S ribosomal protein L22 [Deltaproteobacteria bacterium GWF2_42_12]OGQ24773.1 MAG: 50S ribosomal protein L22 [Deltaproteobacteria bacterium RIFCSPHIGHO2_02_FULL_42_44]OGQ36821.1 MAG: 50S ribosomal protein L22 [Deltaproteobacteria bacteri
MEAKASARYVRVSPQKARLVIDLIRGKKINDAIARLAFTKKAVAKEIDKILKSAIANAENTKKMDVDNLYVKKAYVDQGPTMKRIHAKAMGRANVIRRRNSHITIVLDEK